MSKYSALPSVFLSHGAPSLLIDDSAAHQFLHGLGRYLGQPEAILVISAHWCTAMPALTGAERPETIYDFWGFADALYEKSYPALGSPVLAQEVAGMLSAQGFQVDIHPSRGLDHGAWVPLMLMYPDAAIPVVQLSVQPSQDTLYHLRIGQALYGLRKQGILIMGSGGATHNLSDFRGQAIDAEPANYALAFDAWLEEQIVCGNTQALLDYLKRGPSAAKNHPTAEHFLPLIVAQGAATPGTHGRVLHKSFQYSVLSMAAYAWD